MQYQRGFGGARGPPLFPFGGPEVWGAQLFRKPVLQPAEGSPTVCHRPPRFVGVVGLDTREICRLVLPDVCKCSGFGKEICINLVCPQTVGKHMLVRDGGTVALLLTGGGSLVHSTAFSAMPNRELSTTDVGLVTQGQGRSGSPNVTHQCAAPRDGDGGLNPRWLNERLRNDKHWAYASTAKRQN